MMSPNEQQSIEELYRNIERTSCLNKIVSACVYDYDKYLALGNANYMTLTDCAGSVRYRQLINANREISN